MILKIIILILVVSDSSNPQKVMMAAMECIFKEGMDNFSPVEESVESMTSLVGETLLRKVKDENDI